MLDIKTENPKRGDVYSINSSSKQVLIISNDLMCKHSTHINVLPIIDDYVVATSSVTIHRSYLDKKTNEVSPEIMNKIGNSLHDLFVNNNQNQSIILIEYIQ